MRPVVWNKQRSKTGAGAGASAWRRRRPRAQRVEAPSFADQSFVPTLDEGLSGESTTRSADPILHGGLPTPAQVIANRLPLETLTLDPLPAYDPDRGLETMSLSLDPIPAYDPNLAGESLSLEFEAAPLSSSVRSGSLPAIEVSDSLGPATWVGEEASEASLSLDLSTSFDLDAVEKQGEGPLEGAEPDPAEASLELLLDELSEQPAPPAEDGSELELEPAEEDELSLEVEAEESPEDAASPEPAAEDEEPVTELAAEEPEPPAEEPAPEAAPADEDSSIEPAVAEREPAAPPPDEPDEVPTGPSPRPTALDEPSDSGELAASSLDEEPAAPAALWRPVLAEIVPAWPVPRIPPIEVLPGEWCPPVDSGGRSVWPGGEGGLESLELELGAESLELAMEGAEPVDASLDDLLFAEGQGPPNPRSGVSLELLADLDSVEESGPVDSIADVPGDWLEASADPVEGEESELDLEPAGPETWVQPPPELPPEPEAEPDGEAPTRVTSPEEIEHALEEAAAADRLANAEGAIRPAAEASDDAFAQLGEEPSIVRPSLGPNPTRDEPGPAGSASGTVAAVVETLRRATAAPGGGPAAIEIGDPAPMRITAPRPRARLQFVDPGAPVEPEPVVAADLAPSFSPQPVAAQDEPAERGFVETEPQMRVPKLSLGASIADTPAPPPPSLPPEEPEEPEEPPTEPARPPLPRRATPALDALAAAPAVEDPTERQEPAEPIAGHVPPPAAPEPDDLDLAADEEPTEPHKAPPARAQEDSSTQAGPSLVIDSLEASIELSFADSVSTAGQVQPNYTDFLPELELEATEEGAQQAPFVEGEPTGEHLLELADGASVDSLTLEVEESAAADVVVDGGAILVDLSGRRPAPAIEDVTAGVAVAPAQPVRTWEGRSGGESEDKTTDLVALARLTRPAPAAASEGEGEGEDWLDGLPDADDPPQEDETT